MSIRVETDERVEIRDVTADVSGAIPDDVSEGVCTVFVPHTTAGVVVNESEGRLVADVERVLESLVPRGDGYEHDSIDDNGDAHLRAMLLGTSVSIPVENGSPALGTWQSILFVECDGPRSRSLEVVTASAEAID